MAQVNQVQAFLERMKNNPFLQNMSLKDLSRLEKHIYFLKGYHEPIDKQINKMDQMLLTVSKARQELEGEILALTNASSNSKAVNQQLLAKATIISAFMLIVVTLLVGVVTHSKEINNVLDMESNSFLKLLAAFLTAAEAYLVYLIYSYFTDMSRNRKNINTNMTQERRKTGILA